MIVWGYIGPDKKKKEKKEALWAVYDKIVESEIKEPIYMLWLGSKYIDTVNYNQVA